MATVIMPGSLLVQTNSLHPLWGLPPPLSWLLLIIGVALIVVGLSLLYATIRLFATIGQGTLAPWDATRRLVVVGIYRHVRNPMMTGVFAILVGEALLSGSPAVLTWTVVAIAVTVVYIPLSEERGLVERFGATYLDYQRNVPRWIPRRTPWSPPEP
jgi:protein-S-isoprenylcysteine O-methyltransferase Ste14